jgi:SpoIIAA-like
VVVDNDTRSDPAVQFMRGNTDLHLGVRYLNEREVLMHTHSIVSIPTERASLHAFEVRAKITKTDIEMMATTLKTAFDAQGTIDILIKISNWDGIELGAVFDMKSMSAQAQANSHVRRYAVIGAPLWAKVMINLFSPLTPVEEKTFDLAEVDAAWLWVSA